MFVHLHSIKCHGYLLCLNEVMMRMPPRNFTTPPSRKQASARHPCEEELKTLTTDWTAAKVREGNCREGELLHVDVRLEVHGELGLAGETQLAVGAGVGVGLEVAGEGPLPAAPVVAGRAGELFAPATAI